MEFLRNCGDFDTPDLEHEEEFYQDVMASLATQETVLPRIKTLIEETKAVELPITKPIYRVQLRYRKNVTQEMKMKVQYDPVI